MLCDVCSLLLGSLRVLHLLAQVLLCLAAVLLLCLLLKSFVIGPYYKKLHAESKDNKEILVLGMSAFVFFMLTVRTLLRFWDLFFPHGRVSRGAPLSCR